MPHCNQSPRLACAFAAALLAPAIGHAQAIERNLPPPAAAAPTAVPQATAPAASDDDRPLGPALEAIVVIGPTDAVRESAPGPLDLKGAARLDTPEGARALRPFISRPMTRRLVSEIADAIVRYYRARGFPFVQVTAPPQEITGGVLDLRVVEFRLGAVVVHGAGEKEQAYLKSRLRSPRGAPIDARRLQEDLDQLNRYPFRALSAAFTPGSGLGQSDLLLSAAEQRPWRVYATASNSGTAQTGWERLAFGALFGGLPIPDPTLALQVTGSPDFWGKVSQLYPSRDKSRYASVATRFDAPIAAGQGIQLSFDALETSVIQDPFSARQKVLEGSAGYRTLVSNVLPLSGEAELGVEARREDKDTDFAGVNVFSAAADIFQVYGRWSGAWNGPFKDRSALNMAVHFSPGGVGDDNSDQALALASGGRVKSARYVYVNASLAQGFSLPAGLSLSTLIIGQYASGPLPDTEQMGLGGQDLIRGYSLDTGAYDEGILGRVELHARSVPLLHHLGPAGDRISPYVFADAGHGHNRGQGGDIDLASSGLGADYAVGGAVTAQVDGAHDWIRSSVPHASDWRVQGRITVAY